MTLTLVANIDATTRRLRVTGSVTGIAPGYAFRLDDELLTLQGFISDAGRYQDPHGWYVNRGVDGSTAASHTAGAAILGATDAFASADSGTTPPSPWAGGGGGLPTGWTQDTGDPANLDSNGGSLVIGGDMTLGRSGTPGSLLLWSGGGDLLDNPRVRSLVSDPTGAEGIPAPLATLGLRLGMGQAWLKTGVGDTDWTQIGGVPAGATAIKTFTVTAADVIAAWDVDDGVGYVEVGSFGAGDVIIGNAIVLSNTLDAGAAAGYYLFTAGQTTAVVYATGDVATAVVVADASGVVADAFDASGPVYRFTAPGSGYLYIDSLPATGEIVFGIFTAREGASGGQTADVQAALDGANAPDAGNVFATMADVGPGGPGGVRLLDLGVVAASDLASGPVTVYTPAEGEIVGPVLLRDIVYMSGAANNALVFARDEGLPPMAGWDSDLARDGYSVAQAINNQLAVTTTGPVIATLGPTGVDAEIPWFTRTTWAAETTFAENASIIAAGHFWLASGGPADSGASEPDWASNFGGSVVDGDLTWFDGDPVAGSAHAYAYVATPVAP